MLLCSCLRWRSEDLSHNRNLFSGNNLFWLHPSPVWGGAVTELSQLVVGAYCQMSIFSQSSHTAELYSSPWHLTLGPGGQAILSYTAGKDKGDCLFPSKTVHVGGQFTLNKALSNGARTEFWDSLPSVIFAGWFCNEM